MIPLKVIPVGGLSSVVTMVGGTSDKPLTMVNFVTHLLSNPMARPTSRPPTYNCRIVGRRYSRICRTGFESRLALRGR